MANQQQAPKTGAGKARDDRDIDDIETEIDEALEDADDDEADRKLDAALERANDADPDEVLIDLESDEDEDGAEEGGTARSGRA